MERRPRAPSLRVMAWSAMASRAPSSKISSTSSMSKSLANCLVTAFLGWVRMRHQGLPVQGLEGGHHGQAAHQLGDEAELDDVLGLHELQEVLLARPWR